MKKFSQFDLIKSAVVTGTGSVMGKLFESKYVELEIKVRKNSLLRGKILVSDVNDALEREYEDDPNTRFKYFTIEKLFNLLYTDFIRQIQRGSYSYVENGRKREKVIDQSTIAQSLLVQIKKLREENSEPVNTMRRVRDNHYVFEDIRMKKKQRDNPILMYPIKILKSLALRGEVFLNDIYEQYPEVDLTVEDLISLRFEDVIRQIKSGNYDILHAIVKSVNAEE